MSFVGPSAGTLQERQRMGTQIQNNFGGGLGGAAGGGSGPSFADHGANTVNSVMDALNSGDPGSIVSALGGMGNYAQAAQQQQQSGSPSLSWNLASAPANSLPSFGSPQQLPNALAGSPFQQQFSMEPMAPTQGQAQSEVANLYQNLLGRAPDPAGMEYWQNYSGPNRTEAFINAADPNNDLKYFNAVPGINRLSRDFTLNTALPGQAQGGFGVGDPSRTAADYRQPTESSILQQQQQEEIDNLIKQLEQQATPAPNVDPRTGLPKYGPGAR